MLTVLLEQLILVFWLTLLDPWWSSLCSHATCLHCGISFTSFSWANEISIFIESLTIPKNYIFLDGFITDFFKYSINPRLCRRLMIVSQWKINSCTDLDFISVLSRNVIRRMFRRHSRAIGTFINFVEVLSLFQSRSGETYTVFPLI